MHAPESKKGGELVARGEKHGPPPSLDINRKGGVEYGAALPADTLMDVKRLRLITILLPLAFLVGMELFSILVLTPLLGNSSALRLFIIFAILILAVIPFSFWVFATFQRQQRDLVQSATLIDTVQDYAIFMLDPQGRVVSWSPGAQRLMGYTADEALGRHVSCFYREEDRESGRVEALLARAAVEGREEDEGWRVRKGGSRFMAEAVTTAVRDETGDLIGYARVTRDVTQRRQAEERIRTLNTELQTRVEELDRANTEITRRNKQLGAVNTAIRSISGALDISSVLQNIADAARELLHSRYAALGVANEVGEIEQFITSGITPEQRAAIGPVPKGHGLLGLLIKEGKPLRVPDIATDPRSHGFPPNHPPMKSLLGVPILFKGRPVGDLYLTDKLNADEFNEEDQDLLLLLSNHAAVAIENARLYEKEREAHDRLQAWSAELEAKVAERTAEIQRYSKELTTRVLQAQEEERKRISRELHDDTAQSLSTLMINLDLLEPFVPQENAMLKTGFDRVRELARRTLDETRALSHDLRPTILDDFGLVAALRWFAEEYERTFGIPVIVYTENVPDERLSSDVELALFRIAQEALTNAGKYAEATSLALSLTFPNSSARLIVEDNGKGFDLPAIEGPTRRGGLGLYGMRERADLLGADLSIETSPGEGTRIAVMVPLVEVDAHLVPAGALTLDGGR